MRAKLIGGAVAGGAILLLFGALWGRGVLIRLLPIHHDGVVMRIESFNKGGLNRQIEGTRQLNQFALVFEDGFLCEGYDTSLAAVKPGDRIEIRAYHDVKGWPVLDPEWWECEEGQLVRIVEAGR